MFFFTIEFTVKSCCFSAPEKITLIEMLENAGTSMENSSQTMYNAIVVASFRGPRTQIPASSADSIPTNAGEFEIVHISNSAT